VPNHQADRADQYDRTRLRTGGPIGDGGSDQRRDARQAAQDVDDARAADERTGCQRVHCTLWLAAVDEGPRPDPEIPAVNGHGTADAIARFYAGLLSGGELDGVRIVAAQTVAAMTVGEMRAHDPVIDNDVMWGLGVWVDQDGYGMGGVGGSLAMANPPSRARRGLRDAPNGRPRSRGRNGRRCSRRARLTRRDQRSGRK
jgi:CubicO group peptidase (beta-lactamase class C family)